MLPSLDRRAALHRQSRLQKRGAVKSLALGHLDPGLLREISIEHDAPGRHRNRQGVLNAFVESGLERPRPEGIAIKTSIRLKVFVKWQQLLGRQEIRQIVGMEHQEFSPAARKRIELRREAVVALEVVGDRAPFVAIPALAGRRRGKSRRQEHRLDPKTPDAPRRRSERHTHRPLSAWRGDAARVTWGGLGHRGRNGSRLDCLPGCRRRRGEPIGQRRLFFAASGQHRRGQAGGAGGQDPAASYQRLVAVRDAQIRVIRASGLLEVSTQQTAPRMRGATPARALRAAQTARPGGAPGPLSPRSGRPDGLNRHHNCRTPATRYARANRDCCRLSSLFHRTPTASAPQCSASPDCLRPHQAQSSQRMRPRQSPAALAVPPPGPAYN